MASRPGISFGCLKDEVGLFKVGLELFVARGPSFLKRWAEEAGAGFFLDLKFHDIPETVKGAQKNLFKGARFTTIHCEQGPRLLQATVEAISIGIKVLGVTVLTSLDTEDLLAAGIDPKYADPPQKLVLLRAGLAEAAGCSGVVCSALEVRAVKERFGPDFLVVCPAIRPEWATVPGDDQKRIMTPFKAIREEARITWWSAGPSGRPKTRWRPPGWWWRKLPRPWRSPDRQLKNYLPPANEVAFTSRG